MFTLKKNKINSKKQFLNKCLQMTGLFKCKANGHSGNANYEYISYERSTTSEQTMSQLFTSSDFNNPATSTMIESDTQMNTQSTSFASNEISIERHIIENYPILDNSQEQATYCYYDNPLEVTRKNRSSNSQSFGNNTLARLNNSTECETIVHNTSPLSELKAYDCSCEFLNSTEINTTRKVHPYVNNIKQISQPCNQIEYQSFNNSLNSNSTESSSFSSPVSCSTSLFHNKSDIVVPNSTELEHLTAEEEDEEDDFNFICSQNYVATFVDDISVQFADTVKILKDNNDEWLYVQVSDDGRTGFIPRSIVVDFKQFISQLKRNSNLKDLLSQY